MPSFTTTAKHALRRLVGTNVISDIDAGFIALADDVDALLTPYSSGLLSARPVSTVGTPGKAGRRYYATDTGFEYLDLGTSWIITSATVIPAVRLIQPNNSADFADSTPTALSFTGGSEINDPTGMHDTVTNPTRITFATAGWYAVEGIVTFSEGSGAGVRYLDIKRNGSNLIATNQVAALAGGATYVTVSLIRRFNAADYVELIASNNGGGTGVHAIYTGENTGPMFAAAYLGQ